MHISEICTRQVVDILPETSIREAAHRMRILHVGCLVVVEPPDGERVPIGILTDRDIVVSVVSPGIDADVLTVGDVMSQPLVTCGEHEDLFDALKRMRETGIRRLPVLDALGGLCGLLSADDVVSALSWHLRELSSALTSEQVREMAERV